jgi:hypothetical protein
MAAVAIAIALSKRRFQLRWDMALCLLHGVDCEFESSGSIWIALFPSA